MKFHKQDIETQVHALSRDEVASILQKQGGYQVYDNESEADLKDTLIEDLSRGLYEIDLETPSRRTF